MCFILTLFIFYGVNLAVYAVIFSVRRGISGAWGLGDSPERCIFVLKTKMTDRMRRQFVRWVLCLFLLGSAVAYAQSGMTDSQVIEYVQQALQQGKDQQTIAMELLAKGAEYLTEPAVRCGRIITGRSAGHAVSFALEILRAIKGEESCTSVHHAMYLY